MNRIKLGLGDQMYKDYEKTKEKAREYYWNNREEILKRNNKYRKNNKEKIKTINKISGRKYYEKNKEKIHAKNKKWIVKHPQRAKEINRKGSETWRKKHISKCIVCEKKCYPNRDKCYKCSHMGWRHAEKTKKHMSEIMKKLRRNWIIPIKDTSIEIKIQTILKQLEIEFFTHQYMKEIKHAYQCDILIPEQKGINQKTIIECDGDFFHMNPNKFSPEDKIFKKGMTAKEKWELDELRTTQLEEVGFRVIRLWENEIKKMEVNGLRERLICL